MAAAVCPRCASVVGLHEGRPDVSPAGVIRLWHRSCWAVRHARGVEIVSVVAPVRPATGRWIVALGALAIGAPAIASWGWSVDLPSASLATIETEHAEPMALRAHTTAREEVPPAPDAAARHPVPVVHGMPLDELFPSLLDWTHPVTGSAEQMPAQGSRQFGAERIGIERPECGAGHCGVDLDGPRGRAIVAVADGVVVRVERSELGRDGRSGRYVRIEHDDGTLTAYMHLDDVVDGLQVGDQVDGGQLLGTLGATAVYNAAPHLHFSLEAPDRPGTRGGDHTQTHYVDPAPFLARSTIAPAPDRRHAIKPAL